MSSKIYYYRKTNSILKVRTSKRLFKIHKILSFFYKKKRVYSKFNLNRNIKRSSKFKRKTFIYIQPFFINKIFFSKLFSAKLIKRLANIW